MDRFCTVLPLAAARCRTAPRFWHQPLSLPPFLSVFVLILKRTLLMLGLLVGWAVAQAPSGVIPASYFGMHNMQYSDWPTFSIGALGKGTQVLWPYIEYRQGSYDRPL